MRVPHAFALGVAIGSVVSIGVVTAAETETDPVKLSPQLYDAAENIGETETHALAVELKPCR